MLQQIHPDWFIPIHSTEVACDGKISGSAVTVKYPESQHTQRDMKQLILLIPMLQWR